MKLSHYLVYVSVCDAGFVPKSMDKVLHANKIQAGADTIRGHKAFSVLTF